MRTYNIPNMGKFKIVANMMSSWGNYVPNQFIIEFENGKIFQSYNSIIAVKFKGQVYLGQEWNYSKTTATYRNSFLNEDTATTRKKLKNWEYKLLKI